MTYDAPARLLRRSMGVNAVFSIGLGALMVLAGGAIGRLIFTPDVSVAGLGGTGLVTLVGLGTALFGVFVGLLARPATPAIGLSTFVLVADAAWVIGSLALLAAAPEAFSLIGRLLVADVAAVVTLIALGEAAGLARLRTGGMAVPA